MTTRPSIGEPVSKAKQTGRSTDEREVLATRRSPGSIAFDLIMLIFVAALLLTLPEGQGARLVPLLIGVPTLIGVAYQLYVDLTPARHVEEAVEDKPIPVDVLRRQLVFVAWVVAFLALAWATNILIAVPIALFLVFRVLNRESWVLSAALAAGTWLFIYLVFSIGLGFQF